MLVRKQLAFKLKLLRCSLLAGISQSAKADWETIHGAKNIHADWQRFCRLKDISSPRMSDFVSFIENRFNGYRVDIPKEGLVLPATWARSMEASEVVARQMILDGTMEVSEAS